MIGKTTSWIIYPATETTCYYYLDKTFFTNPAEDIMTINAGTYVWSAPACTLKGVNFPYGKPIICPTDLIIKASDILALPINKLTIYLINSEDI